MKLSQCTADLLVSVLSGMVAGCSTSTLREAIALTVSASSSDWPLAARGPSNSEWPLVWDKLWRQGQCLSAGKKRKIHKDWRDLEASHHGVYLCVCVSYVGSLLLFLVRPRLSDMVSPEATETRSHTDRDRESECKYKCMKSTKIHWANTMLSVGTKTPWPEVSLPLICMCWSAESKGKELLTVTFKSAVRRSTSVWSWSWHI